MDTTATKSVINPHIKEARLTIIKLETMLRKYEKHLSTLDDHNLRDRLATLTDELREVDEQMARIATAAMHGAGVVDHVTQLNGTKMIAAYNAFETHWMRCLQPEDMTYMRAVMGIPEPKKKEQPQ